MYVNVWEIMDRYRVVFDMKCRGKRERKNCCIFIPEKKLKKNKNDLIDVINYSNYIVKYNKK